MRSCKYQEKLNNNDVNDDDDDDDSDVDCDDNKQKRSYLGFLEEWPSWKMGFLLLFSQISVWRLKCKRKV